MKKIIPFATIALSSLFLFGCGQDNVNYTGCWLGESNMAFEVFTENGITYMPIYYCMFYDNNAIDESDLIIPELV